MDRHRSSTRLGTCSSRGLHLDSDCTVKQRTYENGKWNVGTVLRAPGEMYLQSNNHIADVEKFGQVERIDPVSLEPLAASPLLPTGGHTWCTALVAHANGFLYLKWQPLLQTRSRRLRGGR